MKAEVEWCRALKRGKSVIRNRQMQEREARALDAKVSANFPRFE
jgi:hypothetical protein